MRRVQPRVGVHAAVARTARVASLAAALLALVARNETAWAHERRCRRWRQWGGSTALTKAAQRSLELGCCLRAFNGGCCRGLEDVRASERQCYLRVDISHHHYSRNYHNHIAIT